MRWVPLILLSSGCWQQHSQVMMLITCPHLVPKLRKSDVMLSLPHTPSRHSQGQHHLHVFLDFYSFTLCSMVTALYLPSRNLRLASVKMQKTRAVECLYRWLQNESYHVLKLLYLGPFNDGVSTTEVMQYVGTFLQWRTEGWGGGSLGGFKPPPPEIPEALQNRAKLNPIVKTVKNCWI